jgi:nitrogenase molybdenum-iron protein beta chain
MSGHLENSRNGCALHGALQTIEAIEGAVPIIHSTAGCGLHHYLGGIRGSGSSLPGVTGGIPLSSTNIGEKHVVFGGGSRLREQLKNTVKTVRGDLYAVLSGCATEMVGDDIPAMTKEGREQGFPVIHAGTPGFRGGSHPGYQLAVRALIEQLPSLPGPEAKPPTGLVNIWGIVPQQDLFWQGHLEELSRLLRELGFTANTFFGFGQGVDAWRRIPHAALNLVVSPWGNDAAHLLEEKYGTPWIDFAGLPVGGGATGRLISSLAEQLRLDDTTVEMVCRREEEVFNRQIARAADKYYTNHFQREFALVGETALVFGLSEFLVDTLGLLPRLIIVTDNPPERAREKIADRLQKQLQEFPAAVVFSEDSGEITDLIRASGAELVVGSSLECQAAASLDVPLLPISFPVRDRLILTKGYAAYRGGLTLLEDLGTAILSHRAGAIRG